MNRSVANDGETSDVGPAANLESTKLRLVHETRRGAPTAEALATTVRSVLTLTALSADDQIAALSPDRPDAAATALVIELQSLSGPVCLLIHRGRAGMELRRAIRAVERTVDDLASDPDVWSAEAFRRSPAWARVRALAFDAAQLL